MRSPNHYYYTGGSSLFKVFRLGIRLAIFVVAPLVLLSLGRTEGLFPRLKTPKKAQRHRDLKLCGVVLLSIGHFLKVSLCKPAFLKGFGLLCFIVAQLWSHIKCGIQTPRGTNNKQFWDTSNRAVNLVINNLKGIFFEDDNFEHMAFGVVANWGEHGKTIIRICELDKLFECAVFGVKTEKP